MRTGRPGRARPLVATILLLSSLVISLAFLNSWVRLPGNREAEDDQEHSREVWRMLALKGQKHAIFNLWFFSHKSVVPGPLIHILKYFCHLLLFC